MPVKINSARILIFPGTDFHFPSTSVPPGTFLGSVVKSTMTETCGAVLRSRRNCSSDGAERTDDGRAFHARAAVTGKARSPSVVRRVVGMTSVDVEDEAKQAAI